MTGYGIISITRVLLARFNRVTVFQYTRETNYKQKHFHVLRLDPNTSVHRWTVTPIHYATIWPPEKLPVIHNLSGSQPSSLLNSLQNFWHAILHCCAFSTQSCSHTGKEIDIVMKEFGLTNHCGLVKLQKSRKGLKKRCIVTSIPQRFMEWYGSLHIMEIFTRSLNTVAFSG